MTERDIITRRLQTQGIATAPFARAADVVRALVAVQAQEHAVARWSVGMRMRAADDARVEQALATGAILRTHVLRPTWHFVLPEDIRWLLELTAPRVRTMVASYERRLGLDDDVFARSSAILERALDGGAHLTRTELAAVLRRAGLPADGTALGHLLMRAELDALVCSGAPRGKQHTYALLAERAPRARRLTHEEALAELTLRFFTSHGPATMRDYRWWSSLNAAAAKTGLALVRDRLHSATIDGLTYWFGEEAVHDAPAPPAMHLLQAYDEYVVAYTESKRALHAAGSARTLPDGRRPLLHVLIHDGRHAGYWQRVVKTKALIIDVQLFRRGRAIRRALDDAVARYARFVGLPATWREVDR